MNLEEWDQQSQFSLNPDMDTISRLYQERVIACFEGIESDDPLFALSTPEAETFARKIAIIQQQKKFNLGNPILEVSFYALPIRALMIKLGLDKELYNILGKYDKNIEVNKWLSSLYSQVKSFIENKLILSEIDLEALLEFTNYAGERVFAADCAYTPLQKEALQYLRNIAQHPSSKFMKAAGIPSQCITSWGEMKAFYEAKMKDSFRM